MKQDINTPYITDEVIMNSLKKAMHGELRYTLMNDFLSKYSFQRDLYALKGLLSALLDVALDSITNIEILNPVEPSEYISEKNCILDIKLELNYTSIINIEIQARRQDYWPERSLTYLCRCFDSLEEGESYADIKQCIHIGILGTDIFEKNDPRYTGSYYTEYKMQDVVTHKNYSDKFIIKVLLLNHIEDATDEEKSNPNSVYYWAKLFKARTWEELTMIAEKNPMMQSFVGTVKKLTADEKIIQMCESRRRYSLDVATYEYQIRAAEEEAEAARDEAREKIRAAREEAQKAEEEARKAEEEARKAEEEARKAEEEARKVEEERDKALARIAELEAMLQNKD